MGVVFKYKTSCSQEYTPGYVSTGVDGVRGAQGKNGNALYFVDYDLDNSYDIELALQKIENNYILSSKSTKQLNTRKYQVNDLLMSSNGVCYRLVYSSSESLFTNYTFDIERLGKIHKKSYNDISRLEIYDLTDTKIYDEGTGELLKYYNPVIKSCTTTNRENRESDRYIGGHLDDPEIDDLYGAWLKICIITNNDNTVQYIEDKKVLTGVRYGLRIELNNKKKYTKHAMPSLSDNKDDIMPFTGHIGNASNQETMDATLVSQCPIEFPSLGTAVIKDTEPEFITDLFHEFSTVDNKKEAAVFNTVYLSDYSMDMVHPSGNDIICTKGTGKINPEDELEPDWIMSYKTGYKSGDITNSIPSSLKIGRCAIKDPSYPDASGEEMVDKSYVDPGYDYLNNTNDRTIVENELETCYGGDIFRQIGESQITGRNMDDYNFEKYQIGGGLSSFNELEMQKEMVRRNSKFFIRSKRRVNGILEDNASAGESSYFSSINEKYVASEITEYVTNPQNTFYIFIRDTASKELTIVESYPIRNNVFKGKDVFITFETHSKDGEIHRIPVSYKIKDR